MFAARAAVAFPRSTDDVPRVTADAAARLGPSGTPHLEVFAELCYSGLHFERDGDHYRSELEYALVTLDARGEQLGGDTWRRHIAVTDYRETRSSRICIEETLILDLPPRTASAALSVLDRRTGERSRVELPVRAIGPSAGNWRLTDLVFRRATPESPGPPHPSRVYGGDGGDVACDLEIYSTSPADSVAPVDLDVSYRIEDWEGVEVAHGDAVRYQEISAAPGRPAIARFMFRQPVDGLDRGPYTLEIRCRSGAFGGKTLSAREMFEVGASRVFWLRNYDRLVETLEYIAPPGEVEPLRGLPVAARETQWKAFWARRDLTPGTPRNEAEEEHLRRVDHADRHFTTLRYAGWQSDRGRVYIVYGAPDNVEKTETATGTDSLEIWTYYRSGYRYVFRDQTGFGDFVLEAGSNR